MFIDKKTLQIVASNLTVAYCITNASDIRTASAQSNPIERKSQDKNTVSHAYIVSVFNNFESILAGGLVDKLKRKR